MRTYTTWLGCGWKKGFGKCCYSNEILINENSVNDSIESFMGERRE